MCFRGVIKIREPHGGSLAVTIHAVKSVESCAEADLEALFAQHWSRVYGLLFRLVGEHAEAEDLALEVFWRYYHNPPTEHDPQRVGGWLYRVALRLGFNSLRAQRRRNKYEDAVGMQNLVHEESLDPANQVELEEQRQQVRQVLAQMKPKPARLLVLRYNGLSYAEIATTLEIAPGSVGTLLARAEAEFQKRYKLIWR